MGRRVRHAYYFSSLLWLAHLMERVPHYFSLGHRYLIFLTFVNAITRFVIRVIIFQHRVDYQVGKWFEISSSQEFSTRTCYKDSKQETELSCCLYFSMIFPAWFSIWVSPIFIVGSQHMYRTHVYVILSLIIFKIYIIFVSGIISKAIVPNFSMVIYVASLRSIIRNRVFLYRRRLIFIECRR